MRFPSLIAVAGWALVAAGCGLDSNGLGVEDGGVPLTEAAAPPLDGTFPSDSGADVTAPPDDTGPGPEDANGGEDVTTAEDAPQDGPTADGGEDSSTDSGNDTGVDSGPADAGEDGGDSACPGTCTVAAVPSGWTVVEYAETSRPACSTGYGGSDDVVEGPSGAPATCGCACNLTTAGTCESGDFTVTVDFGAPCSIVTSTTSPVNDGGCSPVTSLSGNYKPSNSPTMKVDPAPYSPGSCTPDPTVNRTPVTFAAQGRLCSVSDAGPPSGTCPNSGSCAATPQGFSLCIRHDGTQTCPAGFTLPAHVVGQASNVADTRGCTTCSCGAADAGCSGSLAFFTNTACTAGAQSATVNDSCDGFPGPNGSSAPTYVNYEYSAQAQGEGCPASSVSPDGGVAFVSTHTVCCQ